MITLRPALSADYSELATIYYESRRQNFPWVKSPQYHDFLTVTRGETIYIAQQDQLTVGFAAMSDWDNFLHLLFVKPGYERQGIGQLLLQWARERATQPLTLKVVVANVSAQRFYEREGFVVIATSPLATPPNVTYQDSQKRR
jgi:GNAT superfamily N-acetyltransferase